jgi:GT2 family glycosyltransferase
VEPHPDDADVTGVFCRTVRVTAPDPYFPNANLVYRRSALERAGGYDEGMTAGEDTDLAWRVLGAGGEAGWEPNALVWHAVRDVTFGAHLRSLPRWVSLPLVVRRHPHLRSTLLGGVFWKREHPTAVLAFLGLVGSPRRHRALALVGPHLARRVLRQGVRPGLQLTVSDLVEVAVMLVGSARHRTLLL